MSARWELPFEERYAPRWSVVTDAEVRSVYAWSAKQALELARAMRLLPVRCYLASRALEAAAA